MTLRNDLLLQAARRERTERTPVWLMRQAGRTDPAYRELRDRADLPLEALFRDPTLAAEISLLPKRLGVDAIILFQDILTPLAPMGAEFIFRPGPTLRHPLHDLGGGSALQSYDVSEKLDFVTRAIKQVRTALAGELPLLGFAGAPLTLAFFLIEGGSPGSDPARARTMMRDNPAGLHRLLDQLADMTADYLLLQIEAGVDAVQLFESLADLLTPQQYREFAHPYQVKVFSRIAQRVPTILFAKEQPDVELMADSGASVLSVGACVDLADAMARFGHRLAFQGNVDNRTLVTGSDAEIDAAVLRCISAGHHEGHILNLSHGLLKETPIAHVQRMIETCKQTQIRPPSQEVASR